MNKKRGIHILSVLLILCMCLSGCGSTTTEQPIESPSLDNYNNELVVTTDTTVDTIEVVENVNESSDVIEPVIDETSKTEVIGAITVEFIDVGQADSCLIVTANKDAILIDAGEDRDAEAILAVLAEYELEDIDLMVLTHPHADHIGGAQTILETYVVEEVMMSSFPATSKLFNNLVSTLESQDLTVTQATVGLEKVIDGVEFLVVGVDTVPKDNNSSSVVMKMTYGTVDIMFTGDAEEEAEEIILQNGFDLSAEVIKAGHHGSDTSSSDVFVDAISPKIAIISVGEGNKYDHPKQVTLDKYANRNIQTYRTDMLGTITLTIDGTNIVTSFDESFAVTNSRSASFIYAPNIAEVDLNLEHIVDEDIAVENSTNQK